MCTITILDNNLYFFLTFRLLSIIIFIVNTSRHKKP
nr:MAG TPA: hypothetical protein [Caudoviricetes sp.]